MSTRESYRDDLVAEMHHMNSPVRKGKVYLMGAGPGDPDLLTVRAVQVLRSAEVVLHDNLVSPEILELIPAWTQVLNVGKRCGHPSVSQEKIHALLISSARDGRQVVRLKGGDPLLFGRVGEEMEALSRAGVDFEVLPGVTSATGAAAAAKIPLTDRRFASKLVFVSNHTAGKTSTNWQDAVSKDATLVVYMPGEGYAEIAAKLADGGLDARTPCLVVSQATRAAQRIHRTTLCELALAPRLPAPALLIIGEVVRPLPPPDGTRASSTRNDASQASSPAAPKPHEEVLHLTNAGAPVQT